MEVSVPIRLYYYNDKLVKSTIITF